MDEGIKSERYIRLIEIIVWCYIDKKIDVHEMARRVGRLQARYRKQGPFKPAGAV